MLPGGVVSIVRLSIVRLSIKRINKANHTHMERSSGARRRSLPLWCAPAVRVLADPANPAHPVGPAPAAG
eukprot:COSAG01_NODE_2746_length_7150_cov_2.735924_5_plen_70_part_00